MREIRSNHMMSLIIGFIDGDGSFAKMKNRGYADVIFRIQCHSSWLDNLNKISRIIHYNSGMPFVSAKINSGGYAQLSLIRVETLRCLKRKAVELRVPLLERKWSVVYYE